MLGNRCYCATLYVPRDANDKYLRKFNRKLVLKWQSDKNADNVEESKRESESLNVFEFFTPSCYTGFDDSDNSFYSVYREVFKKLAAEESEYVSERDHTPPAFGDSKSSYDDVIYFYGYWLSFCTKKTYSWLDIWDLRAAENRHIVRLMEQENKKVREKVRRARNEQIRALVAFVRKRDKRVQAYVEYLKKKNEENLSLIHISEPTRPY